MLSRFAKLIRQHPRQVYRNIAISCIYVPPLQHLLAQLSVCGFQMASGGNELKLATCISKPKNEFRNRKLVTWSFTGVTWQLEMEKSHDPLTPGACYHRQSYIGYFAQLRSSLLIFDKLLLQVRFLRHITV